jgi:hypothetical protein
VAGTLRAQFRTIHGALTAKTDRTIERAATRYAVVLMCEDVIVNGVLTGRPPLALSTWQARTGLSELPPVVYQLDRRAWAARVRIDVNALRAYARAVYAATDAYLARQTRLQPADLTARVLRALLINQTALLRHYATHTVC